MFHLPLELSGLFFCALHNEELNKNMGLQWRICLKATEKEDVQNFAQAKTREFGELRKFRSA
jgi:hypothetical protein